MCHRHQQRSGSQLHVKWLRPMKSSICHSILTTYRKNHKCQAKNMQNNWYWRQDKWGLATDSGLRLKNLLFFYKWHRFKVCRILLTLETKDKSANFLPWPMTQNQKIFTLAPRMTKKRLKSWFSRVESLVRHFCLKNDETIQWLPKRLQITGWKLVQSNKSARWALPNPKKSHSIKETLNNQNCLGPRRRNCTLCSVCPLNLSLLTETF